MDILAGETGWTISNMGQNGREIPSTAPAFPADTDLLIVMLGTNDLLQGCRPEQAAERLERFLSGIPLDRSKILLIAPPPMTLGEWVPSQQLIDDSHTFAKCCQALAEQQVIRFANAGNWGISLAYPKPKKVSANVLTPTEVEDYLDAAERLGHLPMFLLALTTGLRQGELIALKWSDLDIKKRTLTITEKRSVERRELVEYEGGTRIVSLTPEAVELLRLEHAKHPGSPLMFMHPATQRPYSPQMVRRLHNEIIKEAGLDHIRFADLRHTCAVLSLQNGMDAKEVSQMLGHFRTAMTRQNYAPYLDRPTAKNENEPTEASREELRQAADILDHLLKF